MARTKDHLTIPYKMEIEQDLDEGGYIVSFPDLPGCITCAETLEAAVAVVEDAKREWIAAAVEEGIEVPCPTV